MQNSWMNQYSRGKNYGIKNIRKVGIQEERKFFQNTILNGWLRKKLSKKNKVSEVYSTEFHIFY